MPCPNKQKLKSVSKLFSEEVCSQRNFKGSNDEEGSALSSGDTERTIDAASIFLKANGGQSITRQMLVMVDKEDELKISGVWRTIPVERQKESEIKTMRGFYDGRRLSTRTLFVREEGARGKNWEISYDEEKYDQVLRDLRDDKSAGLVIGYTESVVNKKTIMTLVSVERPETPEFLELS